MHTLSLDQMTDIEGGGLFWCGLAMGVTLGVGIFVSRLLAGYLFSKAVGVCAIEAAVS
jgi:hypothetical protein